MKDLAAVEDAINLGAEKIEGKVAFLSSGRHLFQPLDILHRPRRFAAFLLLVVFYYFVYGNGELVELHGPALTLPLHFAFGNPAILAKSVYGYAHVGLPQFDPF